MRPAVPGFRVDVENFALVTYAAPADRIRRHLPDDYELQTFELAGEERGLVSATCFCNRNFRPKLVGLPRHTFNESTYRTYVRRGPDEGVYFFGRYLGTSLAVASQRTLARDTWRGGFDVTTDGDEDGYRSYDCSVVSDRGNTSFSITAASAPTPAGPFTSGQEHEQFITFRLHGYFTSTAGIQGHMPVSHPRMRAFEGTLLQGRFDLWHELGIVDEDEATSPFSVLVSPGAPFTLHPPRPL